LSSIFILPLDAVGGPRARKRLHDGDQIFISGVGMFVAQKQVNWATVKADRQVPHPERQPRSGGDTASPGDATSADLDSAVVDAAIDAYSGTGKPYLQISGTWVYGANTSVTEDSPFHAPALVAWKEAIERRVLGVKDMREVVVVSSLAYGDGSGGIPRLLLGSPRDAQAT
jgi:hypothetical protein